MTEKSKTILLASFLLIICCGFLAVSAFLNKDSAENPLVLSDIAISAEIGAQE